MLLSLILKVMDISQFGIQKNQINWTLTKHPNSVFWNTPLGLVGISFGYHLWSNVMAKMKRKIGEKVLLEFLLCGKARRTLQDTARTWTVSFLLHYWNSISSPCDGNSNMKQREEICLELDDGSYGSGSSKFLVTFLA